MSNKNAHSEYIRRINKAIEYISVNDVVRSYGLKGPLCQASCRL